MLGASWYLESRSVRFVELIVVVGTIGRGLYVDGGRWTGPAGKTLIRQGELSRRPRGLAGRRDGKGAGTNVRDRTRGVVGYRWPKDAVWQGDGAHGQAGTRLRDGEDECGYCFGSTGG